MHPPGQTWLPCCDHPTYHTGNLYLSNDIVIFLNIAADVADSVAINGLIFLQIFASKVKNEFVLDLRYDEYFLFYGDHHILYVQRKAKPSLVRETK